MLCLALLFQEVLLPFLLPIPARHFLFRLSWKVLSSKEWNCCKSFLQRLEKGTERESLEKCLWIKWRTEITSIIHQSWQALSPAQTSSISCNAPWETFALGWMNVGWEMSGCINCSNYFHGKPSSAQKKNINLSSQGKSFKLFSFFVTKKINKA